MGSCSLPPTECLPRRSSSSSSSRHGHRRRWLRSSGQRQLPLRLKQCLTWVGTMICSAASPWPRLPSQLRSQQQPAAHPCLPLHQQLQLRPQSQWSRLQWQPVQPIL